MAKTKCTLFRLQLFALLCILIKWYFIPVQIDMFILLWSFGTAFY